MLAPVAPMFRDLEREAERMLRSWASILRDLCLHPVRAIVYRPRVAFREMRLPMLTIHKLVTIGVMVVGLALAQTVTDQPVGVDHQHMMQSKGGSGGRVFAAMTPSMLGQDAFGAIQEIVQILDADPNTDWSKVDLEALRRHVIDMNEVTLKADVYPDRRRLGDHGHRQRTYASLQFSGWFPIGNRR